MWMKIHLRVHSRFRQANFISGENSRDVSPESIEGRRQGEGYVIPGAEGDKNGFP
jgi:hypothetical protein